MARIRSIKPEFWTDEKIVTLSPLARLLFIGLWNFCDDEGRMEYSPVRIKLQILPLDPSDLSAELGELRRGDLILVYDVAGKQFIQVTNFDKHQKVDKRSASKLPRPPSSPAETPRVPPNPPDGREWNGKEGRGKEEPLSAPTAPAERPDDVLTRMHTVHPGREEVRQYIIARVPHLARRNASEIDRWLEHGADPTLDIFPTVDLIVSRKGLDIGSFAFFTHQIITCVTVRQEVAEQNQRMEAHYAAIDSGQVPQG